VDEGSVAEHVPALREVVLMATALLTVRLYESPIDGIFVYVCDLCGQVLDAPDAVCRSGFHVGPNDVAGENVGRAIRSTDLARRLREALDGNTVR
jgi:hypothetical protein